MNLDTDWKKPLSPKTLHLIEKFFPSYLVKDTCTQEIKFNFKIGHRQNHRLLNLTQVNTEKMCYAMGPGKYQIDNDFLYMEENIPNQLDPDRPIDFCYKINLEGQNKYVGFIENKVVPDTSEATLKKKIKDACKQVEAQYLKPLRENLIYIYTDEEDRKLPNFMFSICVYCPEVYLSNPYNFNNYCNDPCSTIVQRMKTYGFVMMTVFFNINSVKSSTGLEILFDQFFGKLPSNCSVVVPALYCYQGYPQSTVHNSKTSIELITRLDQMGNMPYFNVDPASHIANTRNLSFDNKQENLRKNIFTTLLTIFKDYSERKISLVECYNSLGAKAREISFNLNQTLIIYKKDEFNDPDENRKLNKKIFYLSCNMELIDGQHSSKIFQDIVDMLNHNDVMDAECLPMVKKIFKDIEAFDYDNFKKFVINFHIKVNIKGFGQEKSAQMAAENQNNIKKQTTLEALINEERTTLLKISLVCNQNPNSLFKMEINKSTWSNEKLNTDSPVQLFSPAYFTNVAAIWSLTNDALIGRLSAILAKNNSPANALVGNSFKLSMNWFIDINQKLIDLCGSVKEMITLVDSIKYIQDIIETEEAKKKFFLKYDVFNREIDKIDFNDSANKKLFSFSHALNVAVMEQDFDDILKSLKRIDSLLEQGSPVFEIRIHKAMLLYALARNFYVNYKGHFLTENKTDKFYYFYNIINVLTKLEMKKLNRDAILENMTEDFLKDCLDKLTIRLGNIETHLVNCGKDIKTLKFSDFLIDDNLINILFFPEKIRT